MIPPDFLKRKKSGSLQRARTSPPSPERVVLILVCTLEPPGRYENTPMSGHKLDQTGSPARPGKCLGGSGRYLGIGIIYKLERSSTDTKLSTTDL